MPNRKSDESLDPASFNELRARIVERYPHLSQQQQRIATFALAQPETMAMETAEQLANRLGIQPSALVRFAHALDYQGFREMKQRFKAHLMFKTAEARNGKPVAAGAQGDPAAIVDDLFLAGIDELSGLRRQFDRAAFVGAVDLLRGAPAIYVTAQHLSYPFAALFAWSLIRVGRQCHIHDNTGGYALPQSRLATPEDVLTAISLAPYQPSVVQAANAHGEQGGKVLAITDTPLSPLAACATVVIELPRATPPAPYPLVGLTCVVQALALALADGS